MKVIALLCSTALGLTGCSDVLDSPLSGFVSVECEHAKGGGWANDVELIDGMRAYVVTTYTVVEACTTDESGDTVDPDVLLRNHVNTVMVRSGSKLLEGVLWTWDPANDLASIWLREELEPFEDAPPPSVGDRVAVLRNPGAPGETKVWGKLTRADREALVPTIALDANDAGGPLLDSEGRVIGVIIVDDEQGRLFGAPLPILCQWLLDCSDNPSATWPDWP